MPKGLNVEGVIIMARVLCVLYPDPTTGYPPKYARDDIPVLKAYPNGQTPPSPRAALGFKPGELVGCVSGELGLHVKPRGAFRRPSCRA
jgi:hypothetical protein